MSIENCTTAKADTVSTSYTYSGSNVLIPTTPRYFYSDGRQQEYNFATHSNYALFDFKINLNRASTQTIPPESDFNKYIVTYAFNSYFTNQYSEYDQDIEPLGKSYYKQSNLYVYDSLTPTADRLGSGSHQLRYFAIRKPLWVSSYKTQNIDKFLVTPQLLMYMQCSSPNFTANIVKIVIDSYIIDTTSYNELYPSQPIYTDGIYNNNIAFNTVTYYDNNGYTLKFEIPAPTNAILGDPDIPNHIIKQGFVLLQNRTYYTDNYLGSDVAFNDGLEFGYSQGKTEGIEQGRQEGYDNGFRVGKAEGYNEGVNDSNTYTFSSLLTSVIDVPLNAFRSLFNFEFLGINLTSFFLSLFTVALILVVVRMII
jgi:hypothetical protein